MAVRVIRFLTISLAALFAGLCAAQPVRVAGKVADENGNAIAAARVTLRPASGAEIPLITDIAGAFSTTLESPGEYAVRGERNGYFVFQGRATFAAGANQLNIVLNHFQEFFQSVDVAYAPPAIDPQQPSDLKQLNSVEILEAPYPASQDVRNSLPLLQGVVQDAAGRVHFNGGSTEQTNFMVDGFNVSDPFTGRFDARINVESVRTIDVETSRFSAERGRGSAGSVDLRTSMGDDHWRFGATNFIPSFSTQSGVHFNKWTPRLKIGGPIKKGRAWLHNGFDAFYDVDTVTGLPDGENRARAITASNLTRIQVNLTPSNILTASHLYNYSDYDFRGLSFFDPAETTVNGRGSLFFSSIRDQIYFARGAIVDFGFADSRSLTRESPQGRNPLEILPDGRRGNYFVDLSRHTYRQQWVANAYLPSIERAGSHQLRFGIDLQRTSFDRFVDRHEYRVLRADSSVARAVHFAGDPFARRKNFEQAGYIQDRWSPRDDLLVEAGLRLDWDQVVRDPIFSPRLSAAYAPKWMHGVKMSAGVGVFHDSLNLGIISRHQDQVSVSTFFDPDGAIRRGPVSTAFLVQDRELRVPRFRILSFTVERALPGGLFGRATYFRKVGRRGLSFFDSGDFYELRNWRNDRYDSVELSVRRSFGQFEWTAGYTGSSARSDAVVDFSLENPIFAPQGPGPFPWDTPHRFLSWGWAPLPARALPARLRFLTRDTTVAYLAEYRTGFPFSTVNEENLLVGAINGRRLPRYFNVNLHFERRFPFLHYLWAWRLGVNNLTNSGNPNVVNNNVDSPSFLTYGRGQQRAVQVRLRFLGRR